MTAPRASREDLLRQLEEWRGRAEQAEAVLEAVRAGEVDAFVVGGPSGEQVFTLHGADEPYRIAVEQMNAGTATLTPDGVVLYCNARLAAMVGKSPGDVVGRRFDSFLQATPGHVWRRLLDTGTETPCGGEVTALDSAPVPLQVWLSPLPQGTSAAVCLVAVDLTEVKQREELLERLEAMRDSAERVGLVGSWTVDLGTRTTTWSPGMYALFDLEAPAGLAGHTLALDGELERLLRSRVHPDDLRRVDWNAPPAGTDTHAVDFRVVHRDGTVRHLHADGYTEPGPAEEPGRLVGFLQDVTERVRTEQKLRFDEGRQRALAEGVPDVVFQLDREYRLVAGNERFHRVMLDTLGRPFDEGESIDLAELPLHLRDEWRRAQHRAMAGETFTTEIMDPLAPGGRVWETWFTPVVVDDEAVGVVIAARDVTEQRRAETALRESEATRDLAERIGRIVSWTIDLESGQTTWSPGVRAVYDLDDGDIGNRLTGDFTRDVTEAILAHVVPEDREALRERMRRAMELGVYAPADFRIRHRDGSIRVIHSAGRVILDDQGAPTRIVGYHQDVTERVQVTERLRRSEEMRDAAERVGHLASWTTDLATLETTWSDGVYQIYDIDRPADGQAWTEPDLMDEVLSRVAPEDRAGMLHRMRHAPEHDELPGVDYRVRFRDGYERILTGIAVVDRDARGLPVRLVGYHQDVTEQRLAEQEARALNSELEERVRERTRQLEERTADLEGVASRLAGANRELEAFSYSVSHDLRAPLRAIDGFSGVLAEDYALVLDETGLGYLERIRGGARRMGRLIDDLLALSRVGRHELRLADVDVSAEATRILADLAASDPERGVAVSVEPGRRALADPGLAAIVLTNLLRNAWKFTAPRAEAHIEVGARRDDGETVFFVRDDGAGFDQSQADQLFTPFRRLHAEAEFPGTGIGLAIVQRVVARHGGRCWAEGAPDEGATFFFTLPGSREGRPG